MLLRPRRDGELCYMCYKLLARPSSELGQAEGGHRRLRKGGGGRPHQSLVVADSQQIQNTIKPERAHGDLGLGLDFWLGMKGHAKPRELEHGDVVHVHV